MEVETTEEDIFVETPNGKVLIGKVNGGNADIYGNAYKYLKPIEIVLLWKAVKEDNEG